MADRGGGWRAVIVVLWKGELKQYAVMVLVQDVAVRMPLVKVELETVL